MVVYSDDNIIFEVSENYYMVRVGKRVWYWIKDTGEFDGTSGTINKG